MDDLYREQILDRYKHPRMRGTLDPHDYTYEDDNPLCGDRIRIDLRVGDDGRVAQAAFSGSGCAISQASADLLTEAVVGKSLDEVKALAKDDILEERISVAKRRKNRHPLSCGSTYAKSHAEYN